MRQNWNLREKKKVPYVRSFLLGLTFHFFVIQPIINAFNPELATRILSFQNFEENEEEEDTSSNRLIEEEILHSIRFFSSFQRCIQIAEAIIYEPYLYQIHSCAAADVHTPPPEPHKTYFI